jgi:hypothetical protein
MKRHVGVQALARFREGDLSQRRTARVGAHLTRCARCTDLSAELAGITMLLASTPVPVMPDHLAARIQASLASEAAGRLALDRGNEPRQRELPRHGGAPRRRLRLPVLASPVVVGALAAAGAIAVIGGGGYLALSRIANNGAGSAARSAAGSHAAAAAGVGQSGTASRPLLAPPAFGPALPYSPEGGSRQASFVPVATGVNFVPASLATQVTAALSQVRYRLSEPAPDSGTVPSPTATSQAGSRFAGIRLTVLEDCVGRIAAGSQVLLVDVAKYQGRRATVIVVAPRVPAPRQVWVVGPACSASRGDVIAHRSMPGGG